MKKIEGHSLTQNGEEGDTLFQRTILLSANYNELRPCALRRGLATHVRQLVDSAFDMQRIATDHACMFSCRTL